MAENSKIEWTDHSWNPWQGCIKISDGCKNCYMYRDKKRYGQDPTNIHRSTDATFNKPLKWKEPGVVFPCSWSDFFIEQADDWRNEAWRIVKATPWLTYLILTKRDKNILDRLPDDWGAGYPNVRLGVSIENQEQADIRIPTLINIPAVKRFLSIEPMLGPVDIRQYFRRCPHCGSHKVYKSISNSENIPPFCVNCEKDIAGNYRMLDYVIAGCESGHKRRETVLSWVRFVRDQCIKADVPFFLKQLVIDNKFVKLPELDGEQYTEMLR